jgi:hypothetical protein
MTDRVLHVCYCGAVLSPYEVLSGVPQGSVLGQHLSNIFIIYLCSVGARGGVVVEAYATNRKVAVSIPDGVTGFFHRKNSSVRTMALGLSQLLTEISTRNILWGKDGRCVVSLSNFMCLCLEIWQLLPPGTFRACQGL